MKHTPTQNSWACDLSGTIISPKVQETYTNVILDLKVNRFPTWGNWEISDVFFNFILKRDINCQKGHKYLCKISNYFHGQSLWDMYSIVWIVAEPDIKVHYQWTYGCYQTKLGEESLQRDIIGYHVSCLVTPEDLSGCTGIVEVSLQTAGRAEANL